MNQNTEPTEVEILASLISGTAKVESVAAQRAISARINVTTLARVDSMAQQSKKSRNEMLNMLLDVACSEVYNKLESEVIQELQAREMGALQVLIDGE